MFLRYSVDFLSHRKRTELLKKSLKKKNCRRLFQVIVRQLDLGKQRFCCCRFHNWTMENCDFFFFSVFRGFVNRVIVRRLEWYGKRRSPQSSRRDELRSQCLLWNCPRKELDYGKQLLFALDLSGLLGNSAMESSVCWLSTCPGC